MKTFTEQTGNIITRTVLEDNNTHVEVIVLDEFGNVSFRAREHANWNPEDHFDPAIGKQIALGRAFQKLGRRMENLGIANAEPLNQYRGRLKVKNRIIAQGAAIEAFTAHAKRTARRNERRNSAQEPTKPLEATEVTEVVSEPTKA